jgi:hypothetical protein
MAGRAHKRLQQQLGVGLGEQREEESEEESGKEEEAAPRRAASDLLGLLTDEEVRAEMAVKRACKSSNPPLATWMMCRTVPRPRRKKRRSNQAA